MLHCASGGVLCLLVAALQPVHASEVKEHASHR